MYYTCYSLQSEICRTLRIQVGYRHIRTNKNHQNALPFFNFIEGYGVYLYLIMGLRNKNQQNELNLMIQKVITLLIAL